MDPRGIHSEKTTAFKRTGSSGAQGSCPFGESPFPCILWSSNWLEEKLGKEKSGADERQFTSVPSDS